MSFGSNLRWWRKRRELSQEQVAQALGVTRNAVTGWEADETMPTADKLPALAAALQVSIDALFGEAPQNQLEQTSARYGAGARVPIVGTAQLGDEGFHAEFGYPAGHGEGTIEFATRDPNAYALRVKGDSMRPRIKPGEFVIVTPNAPIAPGDEVLVRTRDGRVMVKTLGFRRDGLVELRSINENRPPLTLEESEIELMHHVAGYGKFAPLREA